MEHDEQRMDEEHRVYAYERYLEQRGEAYGVVRDDLPYTANMDLIRAQVNVKFQKDYTHGEVYQAVTHLARRSDLCERGLKRESEVPLHGKGKVMPQKKRR